MNRLHFLCSKHLLSVKSKESNKFVNFRDIIKIGNLQFGKAIRGPIAFALNNTLGFSEGLFHCNLSKNK